MRSRRGMTLVEMGLAIAVAASMMMIVMMTVGSALRMQTESDRLAVAVSLAQTKLSQLMSNPALTPTGDKPMEGSLGQEGGLYAGYGYEITIKEERIDLAKVAAAGELKGTSVTDQLPASTQNNVSGTVKQVTGSETGGLVDIVRIIIKIKYPKGQGTFGEYRVETFKGAPKKV